MSKYVEVSINLYDEDVLKQALDDLGIPYDASTPPPSPIYASKEAKAEIRLKNRSLGFSKINNQWHIVGDDMVVNRFKEQFEKQLGPSRALNALKCGLSGPRKKGLTNPIAEV